MPRQLAIELLRAGPAGPTEPIVDRARAAGLDDGECALGERLARHAWRRLGSTRALVRVFAPRQPKPDVAACLHVGLAEVFFRADADDDEASDGVVAATRELLDESRARFVHAVLSKALLARRPGHVGNSTRDLVAVPWHFAIDVFRNPAPHRFLWVEDALSLPATLAKRWCERHGWDSMLAMGSRALFENGGATSSAVLTAALDFAGAAASGTWNVVGDGAELFAARAKAGGARADGDAEPGSSDVVFVVPPTSETGRLASRPHARWAFGPQALQGWSAAQDAMLAIGAPRVAPGGRLIYATHSLEPGENAVKVRAFLRAHPAFELEGEIARDPASEPLSEGGYVACLVRRADVN